MRVGSFWESKQSQVEKEEKEGKEKENDAKSRTESQARQEGNVASIAPNSASNPRDLKSCKLIASLAAVLTRSDAGIGLVHAWSLRWGLNKIGVCHKQIVISTQSPRQQAASANV